MEGELGSRSLVLGGEKDSHRGSETRKGLTALEWWKVHVAGTCRDTWGCTGGEEAKQVDTGLAHAEAFICTVPYSHGELTEAFVQT